MLLLALLAGLGPLSALRAEETDYRIGPKDVLKVIVFGHDDLTRTASVGADGRLSFPLIGDVPAAGLTPSELASRIQALLAKDYLVDPQVTIAVHEYRSQRVFVLGEAEKPGTYALTGQVSLVDVLSQAGGPAKGAGRQVSQGLPRKWAARLGDPLAGQGHHLGAIQGGKRGACAPGRVDRPGRSLQPHPPEQLARQCHWNRRY